MDLLPIAELRPELPELESKHIRAVVSLVWPYSSSQREFALLLAEPDFRLRLKKGQTRVRFTRTCAKAIAATGIGIGDTVILGLQGTQFVEKDAEIRTPGRSIDWELCFSQTLVLQIFRDNNELASLNIVNAAPTPAQSPTRRDRLATPTQTPLKNPGLLLGDGPRWSSPAFLKRSRLSDGPFFEAGYDPLAQDTEVQHDKKRRRKSYKDWNVWTYSKRTPSPEKDDPTDVGIASSPVRPHELPDTPVSPTRPELSQESGGAQGHPEKTGLTNGHIENALHTSLAYTGIEGSESQKVSNHGKPDTDFVRDADYYDLYAGPDELPSPEIQYTYGGDTEENTEEDEEYTEDPAPPPTQEHDDIDVLRVSETDEDEENHPHYKSKEVDLGSDQTSSEAGSEAHDVRSLIEEDSLAEVVETDRRLDVVGTSSVDRRVRERPGTHNDPIDLDDEWPTVMPPPPKLALRQTDFPSHASGMLTPIGKEPDSPTLKPLDSSTLPIPSPFPGDRDGQLISYLDRPSSNRLPPEEVSSAAEAEEPPLEASYIGESSFYSSVSAANARAVHPDHESAFTDIRFNFGMDGSIPSRPELLSQSRKPIDDDMEDISHLVERRDIEKPSPEAEEDRVPEQNIEHEAVVHVDRIVQGEREGQGNPRQELAVHIEGVKQPAVDIFDEFTTHDPSYAVHDINTSSPQLSSSPAVRAPDPKPLSTQPYQSETIVLSSDSDSDSDTDVDAEESESEAGVDDLADADLIDKENNFDVIQNGESDARQEHESAETDADMPESTTHQPASIAPYQDEHIPRGEDDQDSEVQQNSPPNTTQRLVATTDVIDLGSGSEDDSGDELPIANPPMSVPATETIDNGATPRKDTNARDQGPDSEQEIVPKPSAMARGPSESISVEEAHEGSEINVLGALNHAPTNTVPDQIIAEAGIRPDDQPSYFYEDEILQPIIDSDTSLPDIDSTQEATQDPERVTPRTLEEHHPDVKIESIEEYNPFQSGPWDSSQIQNDDNESVVGPSTELMIEVPDEGDKMGALKTMAVAATGPARNTRSKTKPLMSSTKDDTPVSRPNTRSRRSKTSLASTARVSLAPSDVGSTGSPVKDAIPASPYSLRSKSKLLSPTKSILSPNIAVDRGSQRKRRNRRASSVQSSPLADSFGQPERGRLAMDFPEMNPFEPSQELGTQSQWTKSGKFANVTYVKDSEEGSLRSELSMTTAPWSDDSEDFRMLERSDPVDPTTHIQDADSNPLKRSTRAHPSETRDPPQSRAQWKPPPQEFIPAKVRTPPQANFSFITNDPFSSPIKAPRSGASAFNSPRRSRRHVVDLSSDFEAEGSTTPKASAAAGQIAYPELPLEGEKSVIPSSSPPAHHDQEKHSEIDEQILSSPPPTQIPWESINRQSFMDSNMPITPDATQQSFAQSQSILPPALQDQSMPMTPQLTQRTSAGLRSSKLALETETETETEVTRPTEEPDYDIEISKTTPRNNATTTDVASPERSPSIHSEDLSDSDVEATLIENLEPPSVGLSTSISYYTPLNELRYFVNRSSQMTNPDVLALVVSASTLPKRADKGPKHFFTTFSITDLSSYPTSTTVQIFRPFAKALPVAEKGDVILLRAFKVKSLNRKEMLRSGDDSAWCVWRYAKPVWGMKRGDHAEVRAREDVKGPAVEHGIDEWKEVEKLRGWWVGTVKPGLEAKKNQEGGGASQSKGNGKAKAEEFPTEGMNGSQGFNGVEAINGNGEV